MVMYLCYGLDEYNNISISPYVPIFPYPPVYVLRKTPNYNLFWVYAYLFAKAKP